MCLPEDVKKSNIEINNKFDEIKINNNVSTTERLFGLYEQPKNNCPYIDKKIDELFSDVDKILTFIEQVKANPSDELYHALKSKVQDFYKYEQIFNDLRNRFDDLRDWGQSWKNLSKKQMIENNLVDKYKIIKLSD